MFINSVRTGSITGRASLITLMSNVPIPGALCEGKDAIILRTSKVVTARNRNSSSWNVVLVEEALYAGRALTEASLLDSAAALAPTEVKNSLNSVVP